MEGKVVLPENWSVKRLLVGHLVGKGMAYAFLEPRGKGFDILRIAGFWHDQPTEALPTEKHYQLRNEASKFLAELLEGYPSDYDLFVRSNSTLYEWRSVNCYEFNHAIYNWSLFDLGFNDSTFSRKNLDRIETTLKTQKLEWFFYPVREWLFGHTRSKTLFFRKVDLS